MGRLDDHAKRRIVELRRAGLSFRKIKKVLELDDIRVTPQAVYLFLKRKSVEPGSAAAGWDGDQPWTPLRGCETEPPKPLGAQPPAMSSGGPVGSQDTKEGIQIISVASLCKDGGQLGEALPVGQPSGNGKAWLPVAGSPPWPPPGSAGPGKGLPVPCPGPPKGLLSSCFSRCHLQVTTAPQAPPRLRGAEPLPHSPCPAESVWSHPPPGPQP